MNVTFGLGTVVDIATGPEVQAAVDGGTDRIMTRLNRPDGRGNRRRIPASANANPAATGTFVLDFGSPNGDSIWWLVEAVITAADDRTAPAGTVAALYAGAPTRQVTGTTVIDTPSLGALVRPGLAVPATFIFQPMSFPIRDGENLFAVVYAPTTAVSVLSGVATVIEVPGPSVLAGRV